MKKFRFTYAKTFHIVEASTMEAAVLSEWHWYAANSWLGVPTKIEEL